MNNLNKHHIQIVGLLCLSLLAAALLYLIGYSFSNAVAHMDDQGKVPIIDAGMFSTGLVTFQTVVGAIRSVWESQERSALAEGLSNSVPTATPNPPAEEPQP